MVVPVTLCAAARLPQDGDLACPPLEEPQNLQPKDQHTFEFRQFGLASPGISY